MTDRSVRRGPAALGRNVLVAHGSTPPAEWAEAPRVVLDVGDPSTLTVLHRHAHDRTGVVIEVPEGLRAADLAPFRSEAPPHVSGPRVALDTDTLRHLVLSNSIDTRRGVSWQVLDAAIALGASPAPPGADGDIVLPDGSSAWIDGGPPRHTTPVMGVPVLHRISIEHGSLRPPTDNDSTADLAADQREAVTHAAGAARIIAPAGSGKTRVLTERARHLLTHWNVPPTAVCLVAFNKRAQQEMTERTSDLPRLQVRTLNALALAVLNGSAPFEPQQRRFATVDEPEVRRLIGRLAQFPRRRNADPVAVWIEALSAARLGLRDPHEVEAAYDGDVDGFAEVLPRYRAALEAAGQVDYDDQVLRAVELLLADPRARATAQRACRMMLVDEFQDLTPAHLLLVRLLAGPDGCVFGVGDDDQTIYGYNGADPGWLIDFAALFPGAVDHPLHVNYRCPGDVVAAADTLLRHNHRRVAKTIAAHHADRNGMTIATGTDDTVGITVDAVRSAIAAGATPGDVAVLTRVNSLLAPVQVALARAGVPVAGAVGTEFAERTAVRAALAWLRLATSERTFGSDDCAEALRRPSRSLHPRVAEWVAEQQSVDGLLRLAARVNNEKDARTIEAFAADIERLRTAAHGGATTRALLDDLHDRVGLADSISTLDLHRRGMNRAAQHDDLTALRQLASLHDDPRTFGTWLRESLSIRGTDTGVTMATVHRVKGLEWPHVVVHHVDADQFPHRLADDVEEERRLFHVAITRTSDTVLVVPTRTPSPFVAESLGLAPARTAPATVAPRRDTGTPSSTGPGDDVLFEALRTLRRELAGGKPAYTVFTDATLRDIAARRPTSLAELGRVKGVGAAKLERWGSDVLEVVTRHLDGQSASSSSSAR